MGTGTEKIHFRQGRQSDRRDLVRLLASYRMSTDINPEDFIVAEVNGKLRGGARLAWVGADEAFLRPIVVATEAQRAGLGRALLKRLSRVCSRISVIARGDAVPFYRHLGFTATDWSSVPSEYRDECECCDEMVLCRPISMKWTLNDKGASGEQGRQGAS